MSQPIVRYWAPTTGNEAKISPFQDLSEAGNLIINNNVPGSYPGSPYVYDSVVRSVSFSSLNNLSGVTITITGIGSDVDVAGNPIQPLNSLITEDLAGPNGTTVFSTKIFSQINSIFVDDAVSGLAAGFGDHGITGFICPDYDRSAWYASGQAAIYDQSTMSYTIYQSLTRPQTPVDGRFENYPFQIPNFTIGTANSSANQLVNYPTPVALTWATITSSSIEDFYFTFLQQGIRS